MSKEIKVSLGGPGFVLFVVFLVLKLTDLIDWHWAWVFGPLWVPLAIAAVFYAGLLIAVGVVAMLIFAYEVVRDAFEN